MDDIRNIINHDTYQKKFIHENQTNFVNQSVLIIYQQMYHNC